MGFDGNNGLSSFMLLRHLAVENKIEECLSALKEGETRISIDRGDLTNDEVEYVKREVERRLGV